MKDIRNITAIELENAIADIKGKAKNIGELKALAREFRDEYGLTDIQATGLLFRGAPVSEIIKPEQQ